jgi:prevent-host-death family protein
MRENRANKREDKANKNVWQIQEAKAKFSQLVEDANVKGYQTITKQGQPVAVILSKEEFDKITESKTSLLVFFKAAPCQEIELNIRRSKDLPRELDL